MLINDRCYGQPTITACGQGPVDAFRAEKEILGYRSAEGKDGGRKWVRRIAEGPR